MKKNTICCLLSGVVLTLFSCGESYDLDKLSSEVDGQAGLAIPLAHAKVEAGDLLKEAKDTIEYRKDDTGGEKIHFVYRSDSITGIQPSDLLKVENKSISLSQQLGYFDVPDISGSLDLSLQNLANESSNLGGVLTIAEATGAPMPALQANNLGYFSFSFDQAMEEIQVENGNIILSVTNNFSSALSLSGSLFNGQYGEVLSFVFNSIQPGKSSSITIPLENAYLTKDMYVSFSSFETAEGEPGSSFTMQDHLSFSYQTRDVKADYAKMYFSENLSVEESGIQELNFGAPKLSEAVIKEGTFDLELTNGNEFPAQVQVTFPTIKKGSESLVITEHLRAGERYQQSVIDLANVVIGFDGQERTSIPYNVKVSSENTNGMVLVTSNTIMGVTGTLNNLKLKSARGSFGQMVYQLPEGEADFDLGFIEDFMEGFSFTQPKVIIKTTNSVGVGFQSNVILTGYSKTHESSRINVSMDVDPATLNGEVESTETLDGSNSQIKSFVSLPPAKITYGGNVILNNDDPSAENFFDENSRIKVGLEVELPLSFTINNAVLQDTMEINADLEDKDLEEVSIQIVSENKLPFGFEPKLVLYDSREDAKIGVISFDKPLRSGVVDENGKVTAARKDILTTTLDQHLIDMLCQADHIILTGVFNDGQSLEHKDKGVSLYVDDYISFKVGLKGKVNY